MDVASEPVQLRDDQRGLRPFGEGQRGAKLRTFVECSGALSGFHLSELALDPPISAVQVRSNGRALGIKSQARRALSGSAYAVVADEAPIHFRSPQAQRRAPQRIQAYVGMPVYASS